MATVNNKDSSTEKIGASSMASQSTSCLLTFVEVQSPPQLDNRDQRVSPQLPHQQQEDGAIARQRQPIFEEHMDQTSSQRTIEDDTMYQSTIAVLAGDTSPSTDDRKKRKSKAIELVKEDAELYTSSDTEPLPSDWEYTPTRLDDRVRTALGFRRTQMARKRQKMMKTEKDDEPETRGKEASQGEEGEHGDDE